MSHRADVKIEHENAKHLALVEREINVAFYCNNNLTVVRIYQIIFLFFFFLLNPILFCFKDSLTM
jgi:hypothetical protein